ncbi:MAG: hypothetical protein AB7F31_01625 [Parachlamydiales bacterium]
MDAKGLIERHLEAYTEANGALAKLERRLKEETDTALIDWVDHLCLADHGRLSPELERAGYRKVGSDPHYDLLQRQGLPSVLVYDADHFHMRGAAVRADSVADYLMVRGISSAIEGAPLGNYRRVSVASEGGVALWVVERRGPFTLELSARRTGGPERGMRARELCRSRPRVWQDGAAALKQARGRIEQMIELVGQSVAASLFLETERDYWQHRSAPGMLQKVRQDGLGLGWANRRRHIFYTSEGLRAKTAELFELLGFEGGIHKDNGEQIEVVSGKGAERWCLLHGDSLLRAGLYALEVAMAAEPERSQAHWPVGEEQLAELVSKGVLTEEEATQIREEGAPGSLLMAKQ